MVGLVGRSVPVMVRRDVALTEGTLAAGQVVDFFLAGRHEPTRQNAAAGAGRASRSFEHFAVGPARVLLARYAGDDDHVRLTVEEQLRHACGKGIGLSM